jgi:hypothetical protein
MLISVIENLEARQQRAAQTVRTFVSHANCHTGCACEIRRNLRGLADDCGIKMLILAVAMMLGLMPGIQPLSVRFVSARTRITRMVEEEVCLTGRRAKPPRVGAVA